METDSQGMILINYFIPETEKNTVYCSHMIHTQYLCTGIRITYQIILVRDCLSKTTSQKYRCTARVQVHVHTVEIVEVKH